VTQPAEVHRRLIPERPDNPYRLGRHEHHDARSLTFPFVAPAPAKFVTVTWPAPGPILNQGNIGGCVGWTGADILNTPAFDALRTQVNAGAFYGDPEGLRLYELATTDDGMGPPYPPDDRGSSGLGLATALQNLGLISSYTHAFGFAHFRQAIAFGPVACGTLWTQTMFQPDSAGVVHLGGLTQDNVAGGHEYMVRGIDYEAQTVRMRNHWTAAWGINGEADIGFDDFEELLDNNGDVTVLEPPEAATP
jgi:hypothetical protein